MSFRPSCSRPLLAVTLTLLLAASAQSRGQASKSGDKDLAEIQHYTLSMDKVTRLYQSMVDVKTLAASDPALAAKLKKGDDDNGSDSHGEDTLASAEARMSAHPEIVSVLRKNGYTPREFVVAEMAMFQTAFAVGMAQQSGTDVNKLAADAHINPANITFMQQHKSELDALQKKYPDLSKSSD